MWSGTKQLADQVAVGNTSDLTSVGAFRTRTSPERGLSNNVHPLWDEQHKLEGRRLGGNKDEVMKSLSHLQQAMEV